jgi:hypothetical protein
MEKALNYSFERRSANYLEWLYYVIKSENYHKSDSIIVPLETKRQQHF